MRSGGLGAVLAHAEVCHHALVAFTGKEAFEVSNDLALGPEALLTFFAFPADHWMHLQTTNVIESPFATVRLRQRVTKGAGSRTKGLLMAYKLLDMAQRRWRRLNAAHLLPLVRAGVIFIDGVQQEPNTEEDRKEAA